MAYIIAAGTVIGLSTWIVARSRDPARLASWVVAAAVVITADAVVGGLFELFRFRPGLSADPEVDNLLGFWLSDGSFAGSLVPILIWAFPGWPSMIVGTFLVATFGLIYTMAGMYSEQGWHVTYSLVGFPIYFGLMNLFHRTAERTGVAGGWVRAVVRYCCCIVTAGIPAMALRLPRLMDTDLRIFPSGFANRTFVVLLPPMNPYWVAITWTVSAALAGQVDNLLQSMADRV